MIALRWLLVAGALAAAGPPQIEIVETGLGPGRELEVWVADAWLLGSVELVIDGATQRHDFPAVYPPGFGESWDVSLVRFSLADLGDGPVGASLTATDAAGNVTTEALTLTIDATPPEVAVLAPAAGATVSGRFDVEVAATDLGDGPVALEIRLDGVTMATALGPTAVITLDASDFAPGPVDLEVEARDEAGNAAVATVAVVIAGL